MFDFFYKHLLWGLKTMASLLIAISSFFIKSVQIVYAWFSPKPVDVVPDTESDLEPDDQEGSFEFDAPVLNQDDISLDDSIMNPEKNYQYSDGTPVQSPSIIIKINHMAMLTASYQEARKASQQANRAHVQACILGMGPTGLIAGLRAYANGASITLIDNRREYTRKNVLRLSQDFLLGSSEQNISVPHNLMKTIFLCNNHQSMGYEDYLTYVNKLISLVPKTINMDMVFKDEDSFFFHAVETNVFEQFLYTILDALQKIDPNHIVIHKGRAISHIKASKGEVYFNEEESIKADWLVNATGVNGRLANDQHRSILDTLFPAGTSDYRTLSSPAAYLAATFKGGREFIVKTSIGTVPHSFHLGAEKVISAYPAYQNKVTERKLSYQSRQDNLSKHDLLLEQSVFYGYRSRDDYFAPLSAMANNRGTNKEGIHIDLACSYYGVLDLLQKMQAVGWRKGRLPLVRQLNARQTTYVGMEIPSALFNDLTSDALQKEEKDLRFKRWLRLALEQFFDEKTLDRLLSQMERGSAFSVQQRVCNKIMHEYESGVQVFNLGDVLAPPHFLTGSGLESAAISVDHWINYMQNRNKAEYIEAIQRDVQQRSIDRVNVGLGRLGMFGSSRSAQTSVDNPGPPVVAHGLDESAATEGRSLTSLGMT